MRLIYIWSFLFFSFSLNLAAQSQGLPEDNFTESTRDSTKFNAFLQIIFDNNLFNSPISIEYLEKCQKLLDNGAAIPNKYLLEYALARATFEQNNNEEIKSYQILKEAKELANAPDVSNQLRNQYKYIEAYTLMILGDYEVAQKSYYELLEESKENKDTISMVDALFSLGQLFSLKEDYSSAQKYFLRIYQMKMDAGGIKGYDIQLYSEIIGLYLQMENFEKAEMYNNDALAIVDSSIVSELKLEFLLFQVDIELEKSNITAAKKAYQAAKDLNIESQRIILFYKAQKAKILEKEGKYSEAIKLYDQLFEEEEIYHFKLEWCSKAHEASAKAGKFKEAYAYSVQAINITDSIKNEKKMQQTQLLAAKYEANQKQEANDLLKSAILEKQTQQNYLYGLITIFLLSLIILIGAFFQKMRYNNRLKEEVAIRTQELSKANLLLSQSNKEMEEFNRIFSHDLKEPLRSIVSFSKLAENELAPESTASEYLGFIAKSGRQLNQLIDDVSKFQNTGESSNIPFEYVESGLIIDSISKSINSLIIKKNAFIEHHNLPEIYTQKSYLFLVFKNLIENGIKYNQNIQPTINIRHRDDGKFHYFEIEDNGIGIDEIYFDKVFEMFQRLNNRASYEGTGLGLSMARKMMKKINGDIRILRSEEGKGSVFELHLPMETTSPKSYKMNMSEAN